MDNFFHHSLLCSTTCCTLPLFILMFFKCSPRSIAPCLCAQRCISPMKKRPPFLFHFGLIQQATDLIRSVLFFTLALSASSLWVHRVWNAHWLPLERRGGYPSHVRLIKNIRFIRSVRSLSLFFFTSRKLHRYLPCPSLQFTQIHSVGILLCKAHPLISQTKKVEAMHQYQTR